MQIDIELGRTGQRWQLEKDEIRLGRDPQCEVRLTADEYLMVSREHALLRAAGDELWVEDRNSYNGTFVNGKRAGRERLQPGDVVRLGQDGPELRVSFAAADSRITRMPSTAQVHAASTAAGVAPTHGGGMFAAPTKAQRAAAPTAYTDEFNAGEEAMLERKLNVVRNLLLLAIVVCGVLAGVLIYQGQEIKRNRETLTAMQKQAENAVGQFMPQLNQRLNRFDKRLDDFQVQMDAMDATMQKSEDRFVKRLNEEVPKIMDKYWQKKANEMKSGGARIEIR